MNKTEKIYENIVNKWRNNKGKGTVYIPHPLKSKALISNVLQKVYIKAPKSETIIVLKDFTIKYEIINAITKTEDKEVNEKFKDLIEEKRIKFYSLDYIKKTRNADIRLLIFVGCNEFDSIMIEKSKYSKFVLIVLTELDSSRNRIYKEIPLIEEINETLKKSKSVKTPIEEYRIGCTITNNVDLDVIKKYDEYIANSVSLFGDFTMMNRAKYGDSENNMSAASVCLEIAKNNGWSKDLDVSIPFNRIIDETFNPNNLTERVEVTYDVIRKRANLIASHDCKLLEIEKIVKENIDKNILIINKKHEFADIVNNYLNKSLNRIVCKPFHDHLENIPMIDEIGNPVLFKSGAKKGQPRTMGAQAQLTLYEELFNNGTINILSCSNAPTKDLTASIDILIITSPLCDSVEEYRYRMANIEWNNDKIKCYTLFCKNTYEEKRFENIKTDENHIIVEEEKNIGYDENNSIIICD